MGVIVEIRVLLPRRLNLFIAKRWLLPWHVGAVGVCISRRVLSEPSRCCRYYVFLTLLFVSADGNCDFMLIKTNRTRVAPQVKSCRTKYTFCTLQSVETSFKSKLMNLLLIKLQFDRFGNFLNFLLSFVIIKMHFLRVCETVWSRTSVRKDNHWEKFVRLRFPVIHRPHFTITWNIDDRDRPKKGVAISLGLGSAAGIPRVVKYLPLAC